MNLFDGIFGRKRTKLSLDDPTGWVFGASSAAGKSVTADSAMQLSAAWACVRLLSETISTLPLAVYRKGPDGRRETLTDHPLYSLLHDSPNADQTAAEFWEAQIASVCLGGNGYGLKSVSVGQVRALDFLRFDRTTVRRDDRTGARLYDYKDAKGRTVTYTEDEIFHLRGFGVGGDVGLSPISYARETLGSAMAVEEAGAKIMANGLQQPIIIDSGKARLQKEQREQLKKLFDEFAGSSNAGKVMVLEAGMKPVPLAFKPDDAQLLESRRFSVEDICRWFRVPPFMIGHSGETTMWGTGVEQLMIGFLTFSLRPYLTRIEQAVKKQLITPADRANGVYVEFAIEGLLRADSQVRAEFLSKMLQNGALTPNEWRELENRPPDPRGDVLLVNSTLVPLAQAGRQSAQSQPVGA